MIGKQMTVFNDSFIMIYRHKYVFVLFDDKRQSNQLIFSYVSINDE